MLPFVFLLETAVVYLCYIMQGLSLAAIIMGAADRSPMRIGYGVLCFILGGLMRRVAKELGEP